MGREQLSTTLATARARGNWIVFVFHGVGGGHHMSVDGQDFEDFARLLAEEFHSKPAHAAEGPATREA